MKKKIKKLKLLYVYLFWFLPDKSYLKLSYFLKMKKKLNLEEPKTFNEKVNWLKIYDKTPKLNIITDKYLVRQYVANKVEDNILINLLWQGTDPEKIPFDNLPKSFVIKCNEGSGKNIIVKEKSKINYEKVIQQCRKWLNTDFSYKFARETPYKNIERRIIIEEYIGDDYNLPVDYKFFMSKGNFFLIEYCYSRSFEDQRSVQIEYLDENLNSFSSESNFNKPENFSQMLEYAKKLSLDIPFVRVDFYNLNGKVYFGEMTMYPSGGWKVFPKPNMDRELGLKVKL